MKVTSIDDLDYSSETKEIIKKFLSAEPIVRFIGGGNLIRIKKTRKFKNKSARFTMQ